MVHLLLSLDSLLVNALQMYGMEFQPGVTNGIGNSDVEVVMFEDEEGRPAGKFKERLSNGRV